MEKEILLLAKQEQHPFLTGLFASFQTEHHVCLAMDLAAGGDLTKVIDHPEFNYKAAIFYSSCIVLGLEFLHEHNVIHRDLKLDNVLLDASGYIKITDFGLCKKGMGVGVLTTSPAGTPYYTAPEILKREPYGRAVDWWSVGVMLYYMVLHRFPFNGLNMEHLCEFIKHSRAIFPPKVPADFSSTTKGLLAKFPENRLGFNGAEEVKQSPLFCKINFDGLLNKKVTPPIIPAVQSSSDNDTNLMVTLYGRKAVIPDSVSEALQNFDYYVG
ncbi:serine/threonine-protein kinase N1-like [Xenopus laevis]|uniref:Serine/threonine-protein kinase N1-like n=2 Tax=Xenopus laevis TaxID=8355 RepID=A0A8J1KUV4_XENLA|nr:serine/threonine-protein kinase N1-like [Xenopus laevis]